MPTGYYDSNGRVVFTKGEAARFGELLDAMKFVDKYEIKLGPESYIGFTS